MPTHFHLPRAARTGTLVALALLAGAPALRAQTLDPSFGGTGSVPTAVGDASAGIRILTQTDDALVVAGTTTTGANTDALLLRYLPDGTLDPAFGGGDGIATSSFGGQDVLQALARQPDGAYVVAGYTTAATGFLVARYLPDGTLDPAFGGGDGWTVVPVGAFHDQAHDVLVLPSGEIVVAGFSSQTADVSNTQWAVARLDASGTLDASFATGGVFTQDFGGLDQAFRLVRDGAGRLLVTGLAPTSASASGFTVLRLTPSGSLDPAFGAGGVASLDVSDGTYTLAHSLALALTASGDIVVGGAVRTASGDPSVAVAQFTPAGAPDLTFGGGDGWAAIALAARACPGQSCEQFNSVRIQADGKILGAGFVVTDADADEHVIARFLGDGTPDTAFDPEPPAAAGGAAAMASDGALVTSGADGVLTDLALQPDNKLVTAGSGGSGVSVARVETGQPLPVELVAFAATLDGARARLSWTTASETNNAGFTVEQQRGTGGAWADLAFVPGHGTTSERHDYALATSDLLPGRHAFRLRQQDFDGAVSYSAVVEVAIGVAELRVARVPGGAYLWVPEDETVELYDATGRQVRAGLTTGLLRLDGMASGVYFFRASRTTGPGKTVAFPVLR